MRRLVVLLASVLLVGLVAPPLVSAQGILDPASLQLQPDELPPGFAEVPEQTTQASVEGVSRLSVAYVRHNPEIAPDDVTWLYVSLDSAESEAVGQAVFQLYQQKLPELGWTLEPLSATLGDEAFVARHPLEYDGVRPGESVLVIFRRGSVVVKVGAADYADLPNLELALSVAPTLDSHVMAALSDTAEPATP